MPSYRHILTYGQLGVIHKPVRQGETLEETQEMTEVARETLCETQGNVREKRGNMWITAAYGDFLNIQSPVFKPLHIQTEQLTNVQESPLFFPHIFPSEATRNLCTKQNGRSRQQMQLCVYRWIFSAIHLIESDIPEFVLLQIFNGLSRGKLSLSHIIKTKVSTVFYWKENRSFGKEDAKVIAN